MPSVPLTKLLNRRGLTGAQLLLTLAATKASMLRGCTPTSTTSSRYLHHCCRRLHRLRHRLHGLHCRHRRPHPRDHPHHHLHLLHRYLHRPLHHPCFPCPCQCGIAN
ncbi:unnamed protein product [Closterium sp. NIES-53]